MWWRRARVLGRRAPSPCCWAKATERWAPSRLILPACGPCRWSSRISTGTASSTRWGGTVGSSRWGRAGQFPVLQVHAADLNGDGKPDVVAAVANPDGQGGSVQVFLNKGDGTLRAPINVTFAESGITPHGFAIGDVNGDGHADLVVAYWNADVTYKLAVMLGNGDGTFRAGPLMDDDFGTGPPLLLDLNGDGKLDLFLPHCCGDTEATHRLGNGDGTFQDAIYDGNGPGAQFAASIVRKSGR